ncbi:glutamate-1-semialdehyde 2,1-aminomutase [Ekhidna lutea]|uniref:Glutamate-1-semialdehyde 2,1-aminomutase n=1 Tax=Ekhidna lutea TaxID=447679 RepID=A0A239M5G6_EKHLU|nr:glutamate-1-semialdehyde 2,1-aminomutase [Ekhidna lutea]SNT37911.1 glutamate-1-semialdehyde 2,1-aminomutase [Ekhidna lutea]
MNIATSKELFERAQDYIPGGVNSPVRAFKAVGGDPIFFAKAEGAYMYDEDGNAYLDLINSWGPMILGHANKQVEEAIFKAVIGSPSFGAPSRMEVELAELITEMVPSIEKVRMVNSGTEATMSAIRLARGFTKRDKVLKFEGCYHGHGDSFLIAAGSGAATMGIPNSPGVTEGTAKDTLLAPFNDLEKVKEVTASNKGEIAAIIIEPVPGNMGCVLPNSGFLEGLRSLCDEEGIVLIFDEVMSGFRLAKGGAQEVYGIKPDLTTLGKIIGGGMPVGAYGGRKDIMDFVSPQGPVYQAGTLSGNPVAMAAGYAQLSYLNENPEVYTDLEKTTKQILEGYQKVLKKHKLNYTMNQIGSMISLFFTDQKVFDFETAKSCDTELFGKYFRFNLENGVYLPPSQFETWFISTCIGGEEVQKIIQTFDQFLKQSQG